MRFVIYSFHFICLASSCKKDSTLVVTPTLNDPNLVLVAPTFLTTGGATLVCSTSFNLNTATVNMGFAIGTHPTRFT